MHLGAGHTKGDTVVWLPSQKVLFSGDLVEYDAACYCGDAQLARVAGDTGRAANALGADKLVPGRGPALTDPATGQGRDRLHEGFRDDAASTEAATAVAQGLDLKGAMALTRKAMDPKFGQVFIYEHCLPFDVTRAYDEASGIVHPRIWTASATTDVGCAARLSDETGGDHDGNRLSDAAIRVSAPCRAGNRRSDITRAGASGGCRRRGARRARCGDRSCAARHRSRADRRRRWPIDGVTRDLLLEAIARHLRSAGLRRRDGRKGRSLARRESIPERRAALFVQLTARERTPPPGIHQFAAVLRRRLSDRLRAASCPISRFAGRTRSSACNGETRRKTRKRALR